MADLSQLQYSPTLVGMFAGQNQANDFQKGQLGNQELAQKIALEAAKEARLQELFPIEKEGKVLANQTVEAELPGRKADSRKKTVDAVTAEATQESDIAAKKATNAKTISDADLEKMKTGQDMLLRMGAQLESVPPLFRKQAMQSFMQQNGMNANAPHLATLLSVDPEKMPAVAASLAQRLGDQMLRMNPAARASMYTADAHERSSKYTADAHERSAHYTADQMLEAARTRAAAKGVPEGIPTPENILALSAMGKLSADKLIGLATLASTFATDPALKAQYDEVSRVLQQRELNRGAAAQGGKATVNPEGGLEQRPIPQPALPGSAKPPPNTGQTKGGTKYQIVTPN